jgi:histidinol-phosphate aminotransferase
MPVTTSPSRRGFLRIFGGRTSSLRAPNGAPLSGAFLAARGLEAHLAEAMQAGRPPRPLLPPGVHEIRINTNENPLGPGQAVLDAIVGKFPEAGRYPFNATPADGDLAAAIAAKFAVKTANVVLGVGSQEILRNAVLAFTSPTRGLVTGAPSFENCPAIAKKLGHPIVEVKVDSAMRLDLEPMIAAATGAGLVFFNNPNNPTGTVHGAKTVVDFVERIHKASPDTVILIDEAYHDYVTDPSHQTAVPLALETPNVLVTRTFSKAYGMAGVRVGYGIGRTETMAKLGRLRMPYNVNVFGVAGAIAALGEAKHLAAESARNTEVRAFTAKAFTDLGFTPSDSQGNFLFVDIGRPAKEFREACAKAGVMVGRDFPPFEKTHARVSIGTMDEMVRATAVFRDVLRPQTSSSDVRK